MAYVLIKKKGVKKWAGAIPVKVGVSKSRLQFLVKNYLKLGLSARIITNIEFSRMITKSKVKPVKKRKIVKRKIKTKSKSRSKRKR